MESLSGLRASDAIAGGGSHLIRPDLRCKINIGVVEIYGPTLRVFQGLIIILPATQPRLQRNYILVPENL